MKINESPLVSIITINFNSLQYTLDLLKSIVDLNYPNIEVIVVDNASKEDPRNLIISKFPEVTVVRSDKNLGFAGGNNLGVEKSEGDYLFFVNNDTEIQNGLIENLISVFYLKPNVGAVSPKIIYYGTNLIQFAGYTPLSLTGRNRAIGNKLTDGPEFQSIVVTPYLHGAAMMFSRSVVEQVGLMPEIYFLYYEEMDWSEIVKRAGFDLYVNQRAVIHHKESMSIGKMNPLKSYYLFRNRILFVRRNFTLSRRVFFMVYITLIALPKNLLTSVLKSEKMHFKAILRGFWWNIIYKS
ncbi:glycosyltransferase family 2 protein [Marivirga sp.]|uniref:glycosyltransferase family 2 protein n=1 Tax=Marivirga sp. TaxID=2018662 RepID=UPI003DA7053E